MLTSTSDSFVVISSLSLLFSFVAAPEAAKKATWPHIENASIESHEEFYINSREVRCFISNIHIMESLQEQQIVAASLPSPHITTTLTEVTHKLPMKPPCRIMLKNEFEQPLGSFKLRGIGHLIRKSIERAKLQYPQKTIQVFASSGGNAGLAAAYLAFYYKVRCTVVLPVISKPIVRQKLQDYGANVICYGDNIGQADNHLKDIINALDTSETVPIYCHPFQHPLVWAGHASLVDEIVEHQLEEDELAHFKGMVCSVGGGGLYNGIYQGLQKHNIDLNVLLLETTQAPTLFESIKANKLINLQSVTSMATSLACSHTTEVTLKNFFSTDVVKSELAMIDDLDAIRACLRYYNLFDKVVEPACGAAISVLFDKLDILYKSFGHLKEDDIVVVVVCGGSCTSFKDIRQFEQLITRSEQKL